MMNRPAAGISKRLDWLKLSRETTKKTMGKYTLLATGFGLVLILSLLHSGGPAVQGQVGGGVLEERRAAMVKEQIERRGIHDPQILEAMRATPRHRFVPQAVQDQAYGDYPLPIGWDQTISQPYIVALMVELLQAKGGEKVLEIGTGSGYHAAVMSQLVDEVYTIEIVEPLANRAEETLRTLGYDNVHVRVGDGYRGWTEQAPFDAIVLTAAPPVVPKPLLRQLKVGGRMILPLGKGTQDLVVITRTVDGFDRRTVAAVRFVPMTGEVQGDER